MTTIGQAAALSSDINSNVPVSLDAVQKYVQIIEPSFDPDAAITDLALLRTEAESGYKRYIVAGRDAMRAHMQRVYAIYCATMDSEKRGYVLNKLRDALKAREVKVSSATTDEIAFIRTVFDHLSDKSVSMYAASLSEARLHSKVEVDSFAQWVLDKKGFEAIREIAANRPVSGPAAPPKDLVAIALSSSSQQPSLDHLDCIKWRDVDGAKEGFRILIAIRNADDTAELKDACLGKDASESTLKTYERERAARAKPTKAEMSAADKFAVTQLEVSVSNAKLTLAEQELSLANARLTGTKEAVESLAAQVESSRMLLKVQQDTLKARKKTATA